MALEEKVAFGFSVSFRFRSGGGLDEAQEDLRNPVDFDSSEMITAEGKISLRIVVTECATCLISISLCKYQKLSTIFTIFRVPNAGIILEV